MAKFRNKYRIESHRKPLWDYSREAIYFLTIVTQNRICNLGHINEQNEMVYSDFGKIVHDEWMSSFEIRKELELHEYIIMPNHIHALVEIVKIGEPEIEDMDWDTMMVDSHGRVLDSHGRVVDSHGRVVDSHGRVVDSHGRVVDSHGRGNLPPDKPKMPIRLPKSISSFIAGFKSAVNTKIDDYIDAHQLDIPKYNRYNHFFQPNYHDRIVRNPSEYYRIKNYIINNPRNWKEDDMNYII